MVPRVMASGTKATALGVGTATAAELKLYDQLFPKSVRNSFFVDPVAGVTPAPNEKQRWTWDEHPDGQLVMQSNARGMRAMTEVPSVKEAYRILIVGDSHTQGACCTWESVAYRLQERLNDAATDDQRYEVWNAGCAFTGPSLQAKMLEKHLDIEPDEVIMITFVGNDLMDEVRLDDLLRGEATFHGTKEYREVANALTAFAKHPMYQGFNQILRFVWYPEEGERSAKLIADSWKRFQQRCDALNLRWSIAMLPTKFTIERESDSETIDKLLEIAELTEDKLDLNERIADRARELVRGDGIEVLDPSDALRQAEGKQYWNFDYHLSSDGHATLADYLFEAR